MARISCPPKRSDVLTLLLAQFALAMFGDVKGHFTDAPPWRSAMQSVLIGGVAAGVAFVTARAIS
jgi:VIT1/CCC1 family predicted Fe2+/Mn2+ transporter